MDWGQKMQMAQDKGGKKTQYSRKDVVAEVIGYPRLGVGTDSGVLHARDISSGQELFVSIVKNNQGQFNDKAPMQGNMIDSRMKDFLHPGDMVVIESMVDGPDVGKTVDKPAFARYISSLPANENKIVHGILTMHGSTKSCFDVQKWEPRAIDIEELAQRIEFSDAADFYDRNLAHQNQTGRGLGIKEIPGVQFRIIDSNNQLIGMSPQLLNHSLDESLPKEERYKPLTTEEIVVEFSEFEAWAKQEFPECRVDAAVFLQYKGSNYLTWQKEIGKDNENNPVLKNVPGYIQKLNMCMGKGRLLASDDASFPKFGGGVLACEGVIKVSPGKIDQRRGVKIGEENQFASQIWVNGEHRHVHAMVADVTGQNLKIHPKMMVELPNSPKKELDQANREAQNQENKKPSEQQNLSEPENLLDETVPMEQYEEEMDMTIFEEMSQENVPRSKGMNM